ncbi:MAG: alpha-N-arabinofuranosidase [Anaerolineae bacterium]|nr:alpha-N-arabinofuranosidase [Anaerolineae bacterium]
MNRIQIDPSRTLGQISRHIFGGFAEHLGRCIYGGIYEPGSPLADDDGLRRDVLDALRRLSMPIMRYPGGNFVSGYRWLDGVGPRDERPTRVDLAWGALEPNTFGTNELIDFCRKIGTEPYLAVNCGDGDMREARDWVEYCNGTSETALVKLRRQHGYEAPHQVKYWGIGNEVDGHWQIGFKTAQEYARAATEFAKIMKWADPTIKIVASAVSLWEGDLVERAQLLLEQAGNKIDYMALHWYVGNAADDYDAYMATSELVEERLSSYEGLIRALRLDNQLQRPIHIAVDEWNVWYRTFRMDEPPLDQLEERYNLEDALVNAMQLNAFIRHARSVKMANIAQIVNVIAPIFTRPDGLFLQTIFFPFELYSRTCGDTALDVFWEGDTFSGGAYAGVRVLDVAATLRADANEIVVYVVNRGRMDAVETTLTLAEGAFAGPVDLHVVNGPDVKAENSFDAPDVVGTRGTTLQAEGRSLTVAFEPHSVNALVFRVG